MSNDVQPEKIGLSNPMLLDQQDFRLTETRSGDAPVMCRMRETDNGSVPAERFGPCMARRVRTLFRLQSRVAGQVLLQGGEALLQKRLLQSLITEEEVLASFVTSGSDERSPL
ncbi:hypothetical protein ALC57_08776 [Trachymyrmex cornetzi]|uniref:Uncharacterized protein n=1 Tax=Trachymyrmex cornetzi TaxID=471704 RepID=A0A195E1C3_9HYME|nr:hypothetical protein ALC57_08776 [Trachymyrmex cornetzi]